jgi:hypothetical protein
MFAPKRGADRSASLQEHQRDGPPPCRVPSAPARVVDLFALAWIASVPGVQGSVGAADDIDEMHVMFAAI